jgi:phage-related protein
LFDEFISTEERGLTNIVHFFEGLPGRIISAVSSLAGMLTRVGENAIKGLLSGAASMVSGAISTVAGWGHDIANALGAPFGIHFSEPSEATQMIKAGKNIPAALAKGITSGSPAVRSAMAGLAGNASASSAGSMAITSGAAAAANAKLSLDVGGSNGDLWIRALRQSIRVKGGNVQAVLGSV